MKLYKATKVVKLISGKVKLSKDQIARRSHLIEDLNNGDYKIIEPIYFKYGEEFRYDGDIPKSMASSVEKKEKANK